MAKSRDKTQQIGIWDEEVSKPDHDAICLWAYNNAEAILRTAYPNEFDQPWGGNAVDLPRGVDAEVARKSKRDFLQATPRPNPRISKKTLEYVLSSNTGYQGKLERIVGYADLMIESVAPWVGLRWSEGGPHQRENFEGFAIYWDAARAPRVLVEAKVTLPTLGELMRQLNLYRTAFTGKIVVVAPDDSLATILEEQGVVFVKYPGS